MSKQEKPKSRRTYQPRQRRSRNVFDSRKVPLSQSVRLHYSVNGNINGSISTPTCQRVWSVNNWYDLDPDLGGHQPIFYDFWSTLYKHYVPKGFSVTITFSNTVAFQQVAFIMPVLTETPTTFTPDQIIETPYVKTVKLEPPGGRSSAKVTFMIPFDKYYQLCVIGPNTASFPVGTFLDYRHPTTTSMSSTIELFFVFGSFRPDNGTNAGCTYSMDMTVVGDFIDPIISLYSLSQKSESLLEVVRKNRVKKKSGKRQSVTSSEFVSEADLRN